MMRVEFKTETSAWLTVQSPGLPPQEVEPSHVIAWFKAAPPEVQEAFTNAVGWTPELRSRIDRVEREMRAWRDLANQHLAEREQAKAEVQKLRHANRVMLDDVMKRLCEAVTIAQGQVLGVPTHFAHFFGLTGVEFDDESDAADEVNAVRAAIHKTVFDTSKKTQ